MSDNTPIDGKKNPETDAAAAPDVSPAEHGSSDQGEHAAPAAGAVEPEPVQEPIVIDYDAINANLSAAERADAVTASADDRNLAPMSTAAPVASADADAPSLADDYADSYAPAQTVPATSTAFDSEPVVQIVPEERVVGTATGVEQPVEEVTVATAPSYTPPAQSPIYVQAPTKPKDRSNRGGGILIALLATVVFAVLYAVAAFIIIGVTSTTIADTVSGFTEFAALPVFYLPVIFFFLAYSALIALVNRGGWWAYVLFGFLVGVIVYFSYIGAAMLGLVLDGRSDGLSPGELSRIVGSLWLNPGAIAAGLIAREVPIWAGAWIARRGRRVTAKNLEARTEYERLLADGPHLTRP
ncbi:hypothetical protein E3O06_07530 [Cryobacterium glaciale]|uniref:Uncharacterized protein n=1 Tax=Cryobacterium glaciale TaxID=1259145 RepID=A0A4R8UWQ7_9MICO|nr:hypothetical protein [Cryobacterium glaciale]TFB73673.1 hypothetical protein E3O06_07530 [Cryobacterium glaciale]